MHEQSPAGWNELSKYIYEYNDTGARSGLKFYKVSRSGAPLELHHALEFKYEQNDVRRSVQRQL